MLKKKQISNFNSTSLKKKIVTKVSHALNGLHCSPIVHMNDMKPIFQDLPFCYNKKVQKPNKICHFCQGGGTKFLGLDPTFIYPTSVMQL